MLIGHRHAAEERAEERVASRAVDVASRDGAGVSREEEEEVRDEEVVEGEHLRWMELVQTLREKAKRPAPSAAAACDAGPRFGSVTRTAA